MENGMEIWIRSTDFRRPVIKIAKFSPFYICCCFCSVKIIPAELVRSPRSFNPCLALVFAIPQGPVITTEPRRPRQGELRNYRNRTAYIHRNRNPCNAFFSWSTWLAAWIATTSRNMAVILQLIPSLGIQRTS